MSGQFSCKVFRENGEVLLAVSDMSVLGKEFEEGELHLQVSEDFYYDKECTESAVLDLIKEATIVNAVGKSVIKLMIKENLVDEESVLVIGGVPHAQIIKMIK